MRTITRLAAAGLLVAVIILPACKEPIAKTYPTVTINGRSWTVELATTSQQRYQGLSGRTSLSDRAGMLFVYPRAEVLDFCMRGCPNPIDIAFLDADRKVIRIYTMQPEADMSGSTCYSSDAPAQFAFETAGGALGAAGVKVGDQANFSSDIPSPAKAQDSP